MIGGLKPGESDALWLHATSTNKTPKGKETFEVDLPGMLNVDLTVKDVAHRYVFTVDDIIDDKNDDKVIKQLGKVAVLIRSVEEREGQGVEAKVHTVYKYAVLDMKNLSEKLELPIAEIKDAEKHGMLHELIKARLEELDVRNQSINHIMTEAALDEPFKGVNEADKESYKNNLKNFIKNHFPKDKALMQGLEKFFTNPDSKTSKAYLQHLVSKLWWDTSSVIGKPKAATQKTDTKHTIKPEAKEAPYAHYAKANEMDGSPGKKMLRTDVLEMLQIPNDDLDITNQFYIPMKDKFYYGGSNEEAGPGFIAVKVSESPTEEGEYKYVYLNLSSLSKRTGISIDKLKEAEGKGEVANVIRERIEEVREDKEKFMELRELVDSGNTFDDRNASDLLQKIILIATQQTGTKKVKPTEFSKNIENFLRGSAEIKQNYLLGLADKFGWYRPEEMPQKISVAHLDSSFGIGWRAAVSRLEGNKGGEALRWKVIDWDKEGRYDLAIDDFAYRERPAKYPAGMVPMSQDSSGGKIWFLISIESLKRLGLSEDAIKAAEENGTAEEFDHVTDLIEHAIKRITGYSKNLNKLEKKLSPKGAQVEKLDMQILQGIAKYHPDKTIRIETKDFFKALVAEVDKKRKGNLALSREDTKKYGAPLISAFIKRLKRENLIESPPAKPKTKEKPDLNLEDSSRGRRREESSSRVGSSTSSRVGSSSRSRTVSRSRSRSQSQSGNQYTLWKENEAAPRGEWENSSRQYERLFPSSRSPSPLPRTQFNIQEEDVEIGDDIFSDSKTTENLPSGRRSPSQSRGRSPEPETPENLTSGRRSPSQSRGRSPAKETISKKEKFLKTAESRKPKRIRTPSPTPLERGYKARSVSQGRTVKEIEGGGEYVDPDSL